MLWVLSPLPPKYRRIGMKFDRNFTSLVWETGAPPVPLNVNVPQGLPSANMDTEVCASSERVLDAVSVTLYTPGLETFRPNA